jgi:hypothetical protein
MTALRGVTPSWPARLLSCGIMLEQTGNAKVIALS